MNEGERQALAVLAKLMALTCVPSNGHDDDDPLEVPAFLRR